MTTVAHLRANDLISTQQRRHIASEVAASEARTSESMEECIHGIATRTCSTCRKRHLARGSLLVTAGRASRGFDAARSNYQQSQLALIQALISRARASGEIDDSKETREAINLLTIRAGAALDGRLLLRRRFHTRRGRSAWWKCIDIPASAIEMKISEILSPSGRFSVTPGGEVFITQKKGYQQDDGDRIYVTNLSDLIFAAGSHFLSLRPEGGRIAITDDCVAPVDSGDILARLIPSP